MNEQVWNRLVRGESLEGLALPLKHGRTDLGNLFAPQPTVRQSIRTPISDVAVLGNTSVVRGAVWGPWTSRVPVWTECASLIALSATVSSTNVFVRTGECGLEGNFGH